MRLAPPPLAVGVQTLCLPCRGGVPQRRASILPPLKREVVSLRPVYIVRNFYHSLFLLSDDMGAVFIITIPQQEKICLSEFGVTNETKTATGILFVPLVTPFLYRYQFVCFLFVQKHDLFQPSAEAHCSCVCSVIARLNQAFVSQRLGKRLGRDSKAFILLSA